MAKRKRVKGYSQNREGKRVHIKSYLRKKRGKKQKK